MDQQPIPVHSEQKNYEFFSEPVHSPLVIGNERFVLTIQDQRNIIDRRYWFLSRHPHASPYPATVELDQKYTYLQTLIAQLTHVLNVQGHGLPVQNSEIRQRKRYCFHYDKQTDTNDLPYYQNHNRQGNRVVKHVHFYVDTAVKSKATNTDALQGSDMEIEEITDSEDFVQ